MTVSELIEHLRALSGDPGLRRVVLDITVQRPYVRNDMRMECDASDVNITHDICQIVGRWYIE